MKLNSRDVIIYVFRVSNNKKEQNLKIISYTTLVSVKIKNKTSNKSEQVQTALSK